MTCKCKSWVRTPEELEGLPSGVSLSDHHPRCDEYKKIRFIKVGVDGTWCVVPEIEAGPENFPPDEYDFDEIYLTQDQYENLGEFQGF